MRRLLPLLLLACAPVTKEEPPHFLWSTDAQSLDNPFPDERFIANGEVTYRKGWYKPFFPAEKVTPQANGYFSLVARQAKTEVKSLGNFGATLIPASEKLDAASLHGHVARLVKEDAGWRVLERDVAVEHPSEVVAAHGLTYPDGWPEFLATRPSVPLPEGKEGLLVVLKGPKTAAGVELGKGAAFDAHNTIDDGALQALGVSSDEVIYFLPQKAGETTQLFDALAAWAEANPAAITVPSQGVVDGIPLGRYQSGAAGWNNVTPYLGTAPHVGWVVVGEFAARDLREDTGTTDAPAFRFNADWAANPSLAPLVPLKFVAAFPSGAKPAGGWPMVIAQHGVGGANVPKSGGSSFCLDWAEALTSRGMGCVGIDATSHGTRGSFINIFPLSDLPGLRDNFREMTFDLLETEQMAVSLDADGDGAADVAPQLRYFGNSLGGIMGSNFVPFSKRVSSSVLNVPGAGLSNLVISPNLSDTLGWLLYGQTNIEVGSAEFYLAFFLVKASGQPFFDPGDPINVVQHTRADMAVLQQNAKGDATIPNDASFDLKNALALPDATTVASSTAPVRGFAFFDLADFLPADQVTGDNAHNLLYRVKACQTQAFDFLAADGRSLAVP